MLLNLGMDSNSATALLVFIEWDSSTLLKVKSKELGKLWQYSTLSTSSEHRINLLQPEGTFT